MFNAIKNFFSPESPRAFFSKYVNSRIDFDGEFAMVGEIVNVDGFECIEVQFNGYGTIYHYGMPRFKEQFGNLERV